MDSCLEIIEVALDAVDLMSSSSDSSESYRSFRSAFGWALITFGCCAVAVVELEGLVQDFCSFLLCSLSLSFSLSFDIEVLASFFSDLTMPFCESLVTFLSEDSAFDLLASSPVDLLDRPLDGVESDSLLLFFGALIGVEALPFLAAVAVVAVVVEFRDGVLLSTVIFGIFLSRAGDGLAAIELAEDLLLDVGSVFGLLLVEAVVGTVGALLLLLLLDVDLTRGSALMGVVVGAAAAVGSVLMGRVAEDEEVDVDVEVEVEELAVDEDGPLGSSC